MFVRNCNDRWLGRNCLGSVRTRGLISDLAALRTGRTTQSGSRLEIPALIQHAVNAFVSGLTATRHNNPREAGLLMPR